MFIKNISLLPEVSRQVFQSVAAHLLRAKADVEENGRQRVARLRAKTDARIVALLGEARSQYPLAVGRAYGALRPAARSRLPLRRSPGLQRAPLQEVQMTIEV